MSGDTKPKLFLPLTIPQYEVQTARYERRDALLTHHLNNTRACVRAFDFATSYRPPTSTPANTRSVNAGLMGYCLAQYYVTIHTEESDDNVWPLDVLVYPTYMCFIVATLAAIFSFIVLLGYYWGTETANRWDDRRGWYTKLGMLIKVILQVIVAVNMKTSADDDSPYSLWSVVCDTTKQQKFLAVIKLDRGCSFQEASFALTIVSLFSEVLTGATYAMGWYHKRNKREMDRHKSMTPVASRFPEEKFGGSVQVVG